MPKINKYIDEELAAAESVSGTDKLLITQSGTPKAATITQLTGSIDVAGKADKVATSPDPTDHIAALDATGNLKDSTKTITQLADAISNKHTQGSDTTLGAMTANVNMNSHKLTGLSAPSSNGDSMRATTKITESNLEDAVDKKHTQDTDTKISLTEAPGSDHTATGVIGTFTAGESLVFGELCYMKSDSKFWKIDANAEASMPGIAMALASISADATGLFLFLGVARDDSWAWTVGGMIYASETPGALTQTAPSTVGAFVQPIGIATHADRMYFKPDLTMVKVK